MTMIARKHSSKMRPKGQESHGQLPAWAVWSVEEVERLCETVLPHGWGRPDRSLRKPARGAATMDVIDYEDEINLRCGQFARMAALPEAVDANKAKVKTKDYTLELILVDMASR